MLKDAARRGLGRSEHATRVLVSPSLLDIVCLCVCLSELDLEPETVFRAVVCQSISKRVLFMVGCIRELLHTLLQ